MGAPDIAASVSALLAAFASVRDVVGRPCMAASPQKKAKASKGEARLRGSLEAAPGAIEREYARGLGACGERFRKGDVEAQTALMTTLLRLNTGLVDIIGAFLHCSGAPAAKKRAAASKTTRPLDYSGLALLADASRIDACSCLARLRQRLARALTPHAATQKQPQKHKVPRKASAGQTQWAMVRPRARSASASGASTPRLLAPSSPQLAKKQPLPQQQQLQQQQNKSPEALPVRPAPKPRQRPSVPSSPAPAYHELPSPAPSYHSTPVSPQLQPRSDRGRHHAAGHVPSIYSFASDSTKLGEIPLHRWAEAPDFDEMKRLNAAVAAAAAADAGGEGESGARLRRRGLFARVFGRGDGVER